MLLGTDPEFHREFFLHAVAAAFYPEIPKIQPHLAQVTPRQLQLFFPLFSILKSQHFRGKLPIIQHLSGATSALRDPCIPPIPKNPAFPKTGIFFSPEQTRAVKIPFFFSGNFCLGSLPWPRFRANIPWMIFCHSQFPLHESAGALFPTSVIFNPGKWPKKNGKIEFRSLPEQLREGRGERPKKAWIFLLFSLF